MRLRFPRQARPWLVVATAACLAGCASVPDRLAESSVGCAQAALDRYLPPDRPDKEQHCIAGGLIARFCSPTEARLAGFGKELRDLFGHGDPSIADLRATLTGVRCAGSGDV